jgi:6-phosphogluconolactonase
MLTITIHDRPAELAEAATDLVVDWLVGAGRTTLSLSGGSTPEATYERLAEADIDWDAVTPWLGDERWVPPDHPDSNAAMVRRTLGPGGVRLLAPDTTLDDPHDAAERYERSLDETFAAADPERRPGLVILGIGDDGHTASLFPGTGALGITDRRYVANQIDEEGTWRLTATFPLLWAARKVVFLVQGAGKAVMVKRILEDGIEFPAQRVSSGADDVTWLLDASAASQLTPPG